MKVLLSIKPEFAEKIFNGTKKYEFRRSIFKNPNIQTVIVYASSPVKMIIGEFNIEAIIKDDLEFLWHKTKKHAGINKEFFLSYFRDKKEGFAIEIHDFKKYSQPLNLYQEYKMVAPQSFAYINSN